MIDKYMIEMIDWWLIDRWIDWLIDSWLFLFFVNTKIMLWLLLILIWHSDIRMIGCLDDWDCWPDGGELGAAFSHEGRDGKHFGCFLTARKDKGSIFWMWRLSNLSIHRRSFQFRTELRAGDSLHCYMWLHCTLLKYEVWMKYEVW